MNSGQTNSETLADRQRHPWSWVPSLYFAEGIPYILVTTTSVIIFKNLGVSNTDIAWITSSLYLPWVVKPLWSPIVGIVGTRRNWILVTQALFTLSAVLFTVSLHTSNVLWTATLLLWFAAFVSATHDIAADGFYLLSLGGADQAYYVGIRSTFYRLAMITGQGLLVILAGWLTESYGSPRTGWSMAFVWVAVGFGSLTAYHAFVLPKPAADRPRTGLHNSVSIPLDNGDRMDPSNSFQESVISFLNKPHLVRIVAFLLLYRLAESQLVRMATPFLLDSHPEGGLGLSTEDVGRIYGTCGTIMLLLGGIVGGVAVAKGGLLRWLWWMVAAINIPNVVYVLLSLFPTPTKATVLVAVACEQFGYGFGFVAYMIVCMRVARGPFETVHYAFCTGLMALGMMLPGMASGWIQSQLGYARFFQWVMLCTIPSFLVTWSIIPVVRASEDQRIVEAHNVSNADDLRD